MLINKLTIERNGTKVTIQPEKPVSVSDLQAIFEKPKKKPGAVAAQLKRKPKVTVKPKTLKKK